MSTPPPPETCANCGADIPPRARACPACGADEGTGWREASVYDGLNLPDAARGDDGPAQTWTARRSPVPWYWILTGCFLLAGLILGALALG